MRILRRVVIVLVCAYMPSAYAQSTVTIVVPFAPGGSSSSLARHVGDYLQVTTKKNVVVEHKTGAAGTLAAEYVKKQAPDGLTLLFVTTGVMVVSPQIGHVPYDPFTDFVPVSLLAEYPIVFVVGPASDAMTLRGYVKGVQEKRISPTYGSTGVGSLPHLLAEMFAEKAGISLAQVPYRGANPAMLDLVGGHVPAASVLLTDALMQVPSGVRILAVSGAKRFATMPSIPTFAEEGFDIDGTGWFALFAPAGTPDSVVAELSSVFRNAMQDVTIREWSRKFGLEPKGLSPEELAVMLRRDFTTWGALARKFVATKN